MVDFNGSTFACHDDAGTQYPVAYLLLGAENTEIGEFSNIVSDGQQILVTVACGSDMKISPQASRLFVQMSRLGRVTNAKWQIDVPR